MNPGAPLGTHHRFWRESERFKRLISAEGAPTEL
jgi:hypothetical protein